MKNLNELYISIFATMCFFFIYFVDGKSEATLIFSLSWLGISIAFLIKKLIEREK